MKEVTAKLKLSTNSFMRLNKKESTGPKPISGLFEKYKQTLKAPQGTVITTSIEIIDDLIGVTIPKEKVSYKPYSQTLTFRVAGPLKSEILLRKKEILTHLRGRLGAKSAPTEIQ